MVARLGRRSDEHQLSTGVIRSGTDPDIRAVNIFLNNGDGSFTRAGLVGMCGGFRVWGKNAGIFRSVPLSMDS